MTHPLAFSHNSGGFTDRNDASVRAGDKVLYEVDGRTATMDEALQDGDAFVTFDGGKIGTVKWRHLVLLTE